MNWTKGIYPVLLLANFFWAGALQAQRELPDDLKAILQNENDVRKAAILVEDYYAAKKNQDLVDAKTYKNFHRMYYWAEKRLQPNGQVGDFAAYSTQAVQAMEAQYGIQMAPLRQQWLQYRQQHEGEIQNDHTLLSTSPEIAPMSAFGAWTSIGPTTSGAWSNSGIINADLNGVGRIDRIAFHPTNANILFVGTPSGGLWRVTLNGTLTSASYTCISDNLPAFGISGIAVHPTNGNIIYALTGDGDSFVPGFFVFDNGYSPACQGVYKTTNGGDSWVKLPDFPGVPATYTGHKLAISYTNGNYLFAATSDGLFRTTNGGNSWERVRTGRHRDVVFRPGSDSTIIASTNNSIHYSNLGGRSNTWQTSTTSHSIANGGRVELAVRRTANNANNSVVYAIVGGGNLTDSTFRGVFRSSDAGVSFTRQTNTPNVLTISMNGRGTANQSTYDLCIAVNPANSSNIITGGLIIWRSTNGGVTMVNSSSDREGNGNANQYVHPDIHAMAYSPYNNAVFAGHDGGLSISTDNGVTWRDITAGMASSQFYHFKMRDTDGNGYANGIGLIAGAQDNGVKYRNNDGAYRHVVCCDGFDGVISGKDANSIFFNFNARFYSSTDGGSTISNRFDVSFFSPVAMDWNNPDTMYVGGTNFVRTFNAFDTRTTIGTNDYRRILSTAPSNSSRIFGSNGTSVGVSDDRGTTRTNLATLAGYPAGSPTVTDIKPFPGNSNLLYVTLGGYTAGTKVLLISNPFNATPTITNISANLPNVAVFCVCPTDEGVYVGTDIGVFIRPAGTNQWLPFFNGLPIVPVSDIWANENGNVYASTFGRGIWFSSRKSNCINDLVVSNAVSGSMFYQAANTITTTQVTGNSVGTFLNLKANNFIILNPGFWAQQGSFFKTALAPCDQGANGVIYMDIDPATGQEAIFPIGIEELHLKKHPPLSGASYMKADSTSVQFFIPENGQVEILGRQQGEDNWTVLKPGFESSGGHFKVHFRQQVPDELAIKYKGRLLKTM